MNVDIQFAEIKQIISSARNRAIQQVNASLIELYWRVGEYVHYKVQSHEWGKSVVTELASYIQQTEPGIVGFSDRNIWRMKQFYETYSNEKFLILPALPTVLKSTEIACDTILSALLAEISWSSHLEIMGGCQTYDEKLFYLIQAKNEHWSYRELKRQIATSSFERTMIGNKISKNNQGPVPAHFDHVFKDSYVLEFLNLPNKHSELDLQSAIVANIKNFILEFGRDFAFMGQEYRLQVGDQDFFVDLLFYHRSLNCLVAIELKTVKFEPEHLAQINFYLEALDRNIKKPHEDPSIGILLCKGKDDVVVEYALSRSLNPAMIADYQLKLPNKQLLHDKWQEILELTENGEGLK